MTPWAVLVVLAAPASTGDLPAWVDAVIEGRDVLPSLASVQADAEAAMRLPATEEVDSWVSRARWGALLPRLDVRFGSQRDLLVRDTLDGVDWARSGQGFGIDVAARWGLGGLAFGTQEPVLHRERLRRAASVRLVRAEATELYFERLQVLLQLRDGPRPELVLRAAALDGQLSAITGGRYRVRRRP